jgi:tungstate transport system substrate-binding protein
VVLNVHARAGTLALRLRLGLRFGLALTLGFALAIALVALAACGPPPLPVAPSAPVGTAASSPTAAPVPTAVPRSGSDRELILATTTSTQDSGLLDVLVPLFSQQTGYQVKTVSVGTGAALALGGRGEADVVLVHAPDSEKQWMAQGSGTERVLVMHNDFILVGPPDDPARLKGLSSAADAFARLAAAQSAFVSRGDNSGTQQAELALWKQARVDPKGQPWYIESGTGMGQTLTIADQKRAYTLSDRATWLAWTGKIDLPIVVEGDRGLFNVYHVMPVNPAKFPAIKINTLAAKAFADFLIAPATQEVIANFGREKYGQPLFVPDAGKQDSEVGG